MPAAQEVTIRELVSFHDLEVLARATGPCISALVSIPNPLETEARFKNAIRGIEKGLDEAIDEQEAASLMQPVRDLALIAETAKWWAHAILLLRSPGLFRCFLLSGPASETISVETRFQIRPLLAALAREQQFHVLALSRRNIRLFRCTSQQMTETTLPNSVPRDMRTWMGTWRPDHVLNNQSTGGRSIGNAKGVTFTTSRDHDREHEYLLRFLTEVERGISPLVRDGAPLILAGVGEEIALYRRANRYPRLLEKAVHGSPDGIDDRLLYERARDIAAEEPSEALSKTLAHFDRHRATAHVSSDAYQIVPAARDGRVSDLVVSANARYRGFCPTEAGSAEARDDGEDLLNAAALWTIRHGGRAFELREEEMPLGAGAAAVFRF